MIVAETVVVDSAVAESGRTVAFIQAIVAALVIGYGHGGGSGCSCGCNDYGGGNPPAMPQLELRVYSTNNRHRHNQR